MISVILPAYNVETTIGGALSSLLDVDTGTDFEVLVIDDGSTDGTSDVLRRVRDKRVKVLTQENQGLAAALNRGVAEARGRYIARMDGDDFSAPGRLTAQSRFLDEAPDVVMVGSWYYTFSQGLETTMRLPTSDQFLRRTLCLRNPFAHGGVMMRREAVDAAGGYRGDFGEDYDLWCRLAGLGQLAAVPEVLYAWRENPKGFTARNASAQADAAATIADEFFESIDLAPVRRSDLRAEIASAIAADPTMGLIRVLLGTELRLALTFGRRRKRLAAVQQLLKVAALSRPSYWRASPHAIYPGFEPKWLNGFLEDQHLPRSQA